eukprot:6339795-Prorocentrum_lima.AAC.1
MTSSLVGSEMCIRDREHKLDTIAMVRELTMRGGWMRHQLRRGEERGEGQQLYYSKVGMTREAGGRRGD